VGYRPPDDRSGVKDALGFCVPAAKCAIVNVNNKPAE
jgi:hypothetical protein